MKNLIAKKRSSCCFGKQICCDMAKPNNYKNRVSENIDFVVMDYFSTREQPNHFFQHSLEDVNCANINYFFVFVDQ